MIYFHKDMRYQIVKSLENHLYKDGYLMLDMPKCFLMKETQLTTVFPSVYKKEIK